MRIALIAPPWYTIPPSGYGGIEWVVARLGRGVGGGDGCHGQRMFDRAVTELDEQNWRAAALAARICQLVAE